MSAFTLADVSVEWATGVADEIDALDFTSADPEEAHGLEDELAVMALRAVVADHPYAQEIAAIALRTHDDRREQRTRWWA